MSRRQLVLARVLFVLYLVAIACLCFGNFSSLPEVEKSLWGIPTDKIVHFLMFLPFPVLAFYAFNRFAEKSRAAVLWTFVAFLAGAVLAAGTEIGQALLTSHRTGDPADFRADLIGLAVGTVLVFILDLWKHRN